ncbi:hypothetical protein CDL15_Pgr008173 [Punica granatum]|uniref:Uncharacterized protein n=1 Tax=Punica granatum TaxID=22663 RepID=A0A218VU88_PUNGR|nr:hypothetical protein CDL15_Pgr008173 [Punica granatum]
MDGMVLGIDGMLGSGGNVTFGTLAGIVGKLALQANTSTQRFFTNGLQVRQQKIVQNDLC